MLFTTAVFVFAFLPLTLLVYFMLGRRSRRAAAAWLLLASLFFYGWWMPAFTTLLLASIGINFGIGLTLIRAWAEGSAALARRWLTAGIGFNLGLLGYFKYAGFFVDNVNALLGTHWSLTGVVLPIGISFYTFTQIAFLVDTYQRKVTEVDAVHYGLFVTYFPHLIAGPVLHHAQMMPQFALPATYRVDAGRIAAGLLIFAIGLLKKVVLADGVAPYADAVFDAAEAGRFIAASEAWLGATAYTLQLYFDFSGYSDMAIGISWMFNVRLPFNFDSPYRATGISDFWRRWHVSLSTFLRDYLYIALGGNRKGPLRRYMNLAATMLLGGLWHGASWSFVVWGGLHGAYLMVNHAFRALIGERTAARLDASRLWCATAWLLTLLAVVVAWVFFRAHTLGGAMHLLRSMLMPLPGAGVPTALWNAGLVPYVGLAWCAVLGLLAVAGPNTNRVGEVLLQRLSRPQALRAAAAGFAAALVVTLVLINEFRSSVSAFIYFNF